MFAGGALAEDFDLPFVSELALGWLEREEVARVLVSEDLRLLWANGAARKSLADETDLELRDNVLCTYNRAHQAALLDFVAGCGADIRTLCLPREDSKGHVLFRAREVGARGRRRFFGISFHRSGSDFVARFADLREAFQLTSSEQMVLQRMLDGATAQEISAAAGLSIETVRTHIRNIYVKVDVTSRERLFARLRPYRL